MSVRVRLAAFVAGLAVVFAATFTAGAALRPAEQDRPAPTPTTGHTPGHDRSATTRAPGPGPGPSGRDPDRSGS